ncbi:hypothetical protein [Pseudogemmobacter faecipullorum]|uniref:Uncharacterized protein n=1 Tax=Pseudogemmobacter faecipullorum TaxID=2755041 RepID=A0ABS8CIP4_9RHOB|nr:hypothetical protein [Pseudogemmobacter faecipullorum]MCB5409268.1 hypothetical protein [Pseudogemmobacter faecipullorum]
MSEPLASHDTEDVLSSLRRLVLDVAPPASAAAAGGAGGAEADTSGKLLLTPALRIVGAEADLPAGGESIATAGETACPAVAAEAQISFGEAAPLGVTRASWQGAAATSPDPAASTPAAPTPAAGQTRLTLSTPAAEAGDQSPVAVFTALPRPAPLLLTPKDPGAADGEAVPFIRHPRAATETPARESVVIDEMALRALLRQIVREELAALQLSGGAAPDMRRLVRLELQRAVTGES